MSRNRLFENSCSIHGQRQTKDMPNREELSSYQVCNANLTGMKKNYF